ncbi:carbamoyl-phosphate synthase (glutamine-hydrolyzing) large subunit [Candidatus Roizmanbacteria bacterium]|nr:carbamoyl-phosphate synthase (glutamine-hydrolyzing) large subunit [Candidatus Roizmanbacteria bacterium]
MKKVLILGSGALKIGEAGEFDYSGSQAIKALKEEKIRTILINPNIATIQTSEFLADEVYFLPVTPYFVEKVIQKEKPDGIMISFGGQTALNCGIDLYKKGILKKNSVQILGTSIESVIISEDRELFAKHLHKINVSIPKSEAVKNINDAVKVVHNLSFPVMIRAAYALGGQKSGIARSEKELKRIVNDALSFSPQVLVEKYLHHYKEIEYEVVRDQFDNSITVCNMENMDPLGIHTGESIVVAPSQTLTNYEYHFLRIEAIKIVRSLNIIGECNVQFALNPSPKLHLKGENQPLEYYVIELNARLSRSSALASKATGYPLAYVAAKLALGKKISDIKNQVTQVTQSFFEPALDYIVVKIPRWDLEKFHGVEEEIGSSMKSVGEVMAIGRTFEEAIQKAVRMLDIGAHGVTENMFLDGENLMKYIEMATPRRLFAIVEGLRKNISIEQIYKLTGIDPWYLSRLKEIVDTEKKLKHNPEMHKKPHELLKLKQLGFSDKTIGDLTGKSETEIRLIRKKLGVRPSVFQIDTLAGEAPAKTNYLYMTYNGNHHDVSALKKNSVIVLGSGPYRIGSSVEFDWSCVNTARFLKTYDKKSIIINCNPETVSTDYDISDRLYFEELTYERVADIYEFENPGGIIISVGGQTPNNLASRLNENNVRILGTRAEDIDRAEDRSKFSALLDKLGIPQPSWNKFSSLQSAVRFAKNVGYPVLVRPSYVLSGRAMSVCYNEEELTLFVKKASVINKKYPITVSKFLSDAKEIELDAVAQKGKIKVFAVSEHVEHGGVHSGDATIVYPPQKMYILTEKKVIDIANKLAIELNITGPFNIQYLAIENNVYVIEINLRASRTFPFISKATRVNFARLFVDCLFGKPKKIDLVYPDFTIVKAPQFSFSRLSGADPILRVEMSSTGEVACFGDSYEEAFLKAIFSTGIRITQKSALLTIGGIVNKKKFLESALLLEQMEYKLYATRKTSNFLYENGVKSEFVYKAYEGKNPTVVNLINNKEVGLVVNISEVEEGEGRSFTKQLTDGYTIRRATIDNNIPLLTDLNKAMMYVNSLYEVSKEDMKIKSWDEYV